MQRSITSAAAAILCTGWLMFAIHPAAAQRSSPTQPPPGAQGPSTTLSPASNVSDQQLDKTAAAIKSLQGIRSSYAQKLATAKPDEQDKIAGEASAAMKKAVTDQGLSVDEYNSIVKLAQNDPSIRARIEQRLGTSEK